MGKEAQSVSKNIDHSCERGELIVKKIEMKLLKETYQPTVGMDPARFDPLKGS